MTERQRPYSRARSAFVVPLFLNFVWVPAALHYTVTAVKWQPALFLKKIEVWRLERALYSPRDFKIRETF